MRSARLALPRHTLFRERSRSRTYPVTPTCATRFTSQRSLRCAHNPPIRALAERLRSRGKASITIVAAATRKLLNLAYGILKSGRAFDPAFGAA